MKIIKKVSSAYSVLNCNNGRYQLVNTIGEYESENQAYSEMLAILNKCKTEIDVVNRITNV